MTVTSIVWVDENRGTPGHLPFAFADNPSQDLWPEFSTEETYSIGEAETPPGHFVRHLIGVSCCESPLSLAWPGGPSFSGLLQPQAVTIFPAFASFSAQWNGGRTLFLQLEPAFLVAAVTDEPDVRVDLQPVISRPDPFLAHALFALNELTRGVDKTRPAYGQTLVLAIAEHLARRYCVLDRSPKLPRRTLLQISDIHRIDSFIDQHLEVPLSVEKLAHVVGISEFRFSRMFKLVTGRSPHQYVLARRIRHAKRLLHGRRPRLAEVALRCGFANQSHFTEAFRRLVGTTPGRYR